jgi:hypothetical protein
MPRPLPSAHPREPGGALARPGARAATPKTKILLVRQPVKSVRRSDEPDRTPLRLAIGIVVVLGIVGAVWLMGHLGLRLGFAPTMHVPDLLNEPGGGLACGVMMLLAMPGLIFRAGMEQPMALMLGFVLVAIPAAGLSAARPLVPGGPRPSTLAATGAIAGALAAGVNAAALVWWCASPLRSTFVRDLPGLVSGFDRWRSDLQLASGLDLLAVVSAALWAVLAMRLPVPLWLRSLCMSASSFALAVTLGSMSASVATGALLDVPRAVIASSDGDDASAPSISGGRGLVLGETRHQLAVLVIANDVVLVELRNRPATITAAGSESITGFVRGALPGEDR